MTPLSSPLTSPSTEPCTQQVFNVSEKAKWHPCPNLVPAHAFSDHAPLLLWTTSTLRMKTASANLPRMPASLTCDSLRRTEPFTQNVQGLPRGICLWDVTLPITEERVSQEKLGVQVQAG